MKANFVWKYVNFPKRVDYMKLSYLNFKIHALFDNIMENKDKVLVINHFRKNRSICTKTGILTFLSKYYKKL